MTWRRGARARAEQADEAIRLYEAGSVVEGAHPGYTDGPVSISRARTMGCTSADGTRISSSSCATMVAGGIGSGWVNTCNNVSTDCSTVNLAPASRLAAGENGPRSTASRIPQASASALSGVMSTTPPQSVSGRPPSSDAITRQPECWASIETMPKVSCQYWLFDGITTTS